MELLVDLLGWSATVLILISFLFKDMLKLRITNFIAASLWLVYGFLKQDNPLIVVNLLVLIIHSFWFYKNIKLWKS